MGRFRMALVLGAIAVVLAGLAITLLAFDGGAAASAKKVIYMSAVEYKGGTNSEPFPTDPAPPGGGYIIKPPDADGRWETSTYRWEPGTIIVNEGDEVELRIWGVNGSAHPSHVEGYIPEFTVTRGNLTVLNFTADKAGTFRIHCFAHQPSMEAQLVVLPAGAPAPAETPGAPAEEPGGGAPASGAAPTSDAPAPDSAPQQLPSAGGSAGGSDSRWPIGLLAVAGLAAIAGLLMLRSARR